MNCQSVILKSLKILLPGVRISNLSQKSGFSFPSCLSTVEFQILQLYFRHLFRNTVSELSVFYLCEVNLHFTLALLCKICGFELQQ